MAEVHRKTVAELPRVSQAGGARHALTAGVGRRTASSQKRWRHSGCSQTGGAIAGTQTGPLRVAYWNVQRFHHFDACCAVIRRMATDILLLGETRYRDGSNGSATLAFGKRRPRWARTMSSALSFLELGLGDEEERRRSCRHAATTAGFHGNGILSRLRLESPALIRLETDGDWFDGGHGERRVGGRCAVAASIATGAGRIVFVSVHLESHSGPALRAEQMRRLFDAVDQSRRGNRS